jgi:hypothetical protein
MKKGMTSQQPGGGFNRVSTNPPHLDLLGLNGTKSDQIQPKKISPPPARPAERRTESCSIVRNRAQSCGKTFFGFTKPAPSQTTQWKNPTPLPFIPLPCSTALGSQLAPSKFFIPLIAFRAQTFIVRSIHAEK